MIALNFTSLIYVSGTYNTNKKQVNINIITVYGVFLTELHLWVKTINGVDFL